MKFDFIFTNNLMDHVGLINLLLITQPRLKKLELYRNRFKSFHMY